MPKKNKMPSRVRAAFTYLNYCLQRQATVYIEGGAIEGDRFINPSKIDSEEDFTKQTALETIREYLMGKIPDNDLSAGCDNQVD